MKQEIVLCKDGYFEAIIQLRPETEEIIRFINSQIKKAGNVRIQKIVKDKNGTDFYITSQRFARVLGNKMKKSFKGELKTSRLLFSFDRQTSKRIYRVTILFRPEPPSEEPSA